VRPLDLPAAAARELRVARHLLAAVVHAHHLEAPDDEAATRAGLALGMQGNVRSSTLRAFDEADMQGILNGLP